VICGHREGDDGTIWYYSSSAQLDELQQVLSSSSYPPEMELLAAIDEMKTVINSHMNITVQLVERFRGSRKSAISVHDGQFFDIFWLHIRVGPSFGGYSFQLNLELFGFV
jgi:hypothetical protein